MIGCGHRRNLDRNDFQDRYERFWLGKLCRTHPQEPWRKVVAIHLYGPPSFVYGDVELEFEDGLKQLIQTGKHRPARKDVEVLTPMAGNEEEKA